MEAAPTPDQLKKQRKAEQFKARYHADPERYRARSRESYRRLMERDPEKMKEYSRLTHIKNKARNNARTRAWYRANRAHCIEWQREYEKRRIAADPVYKLRRRAGVLIKNTFLSRGFRKGSKTEALLGCTTKEFRAHLEKQFEGWMTWENYGSINGSKPTAPGQCWDLDHIVPISTATTEEDVIRLNHFTNFQPLCSYTNRWVKSNRFQCDVTT